MDTRRERLLVANQMNGEKGIPKLKFELLHDAVAGDAVALRSQMTLQPAGGEGDKVFPPSYRVDGPPGHKYAVEQRQVGDGDRLSTTVLLDSVASQANRAEMALLDGWERGELIFQCLTLISQTTAASRIATS